ARVDQGRPGPVVLEVPLDVLEATTDDGMPAVTLAAREPSQPDPALVGRAAALLAGARRPLVMAGGGVLAAGAWEPLARVAEALEAPVVMTMNGKGAMPAGHRLAFEAHATDRLLPAADVVLAVGTRFAEHLGRRRRPAPGQRLVRLDVDPEELCRMVSPELAIEADAGAGLRGLLA